MCDSTRFSSAQTRDRKSEIWSSKDDMTFPFRSVCGASNDSPGGAVAQRLAARMTNQASLTEIPDLPQDSGKAGRSPGAALASEPRRGDGLGRDVLAGLVFAAASIGLIWLGCFLDFQGVLQ